MSAPILDYTIKVNGNTVALDSTTNVSYASGHNLISVSFTTNQSLKYYEIRVTKEGDQFGIGYGNLLAHDASVSGTGTHTYNINVTQETFNKGDGIYRIGMYAKGSLDGIWDVTYLLISSDNYIIAPSDYDGIEVLTDEPIPPEEGYSPTTPDDDNPSDSDETKNDYLYFTSNEPNSTITLNKVGEPAWTGSYSTDGQTWTTYTPGTTGAITLVNTGDKIYFKGTYTAANEYNKYLQFVMTGSISASGNIMSFCSGDDYATVTTIPYEYMFSYLFKECKSLTTSPQLPATTLASDCYSNLFLNCTSLTAPPQLPSTTLADNCYWGMFAGCTSLTTPPELSATTLTDSCYGYMFLNCTSLTTAPQLPATTLEYFCYWNMFYGCTSLISVPELPATTLESYCYERMFKGCTKIKLSKTQTDEYTTPYRIPPTGTGTNATDALTDMFTNTGGTFTDTPTINKTYYLSNTNSVV